MLVLENLKKIYQNGKGIKNISFSVSAGEIVSILGPNGSGKSTTLKIISGILCPDEGKCTIKNNKTLNYETKKIIGYLPDEPFLYDNLTSIEFLNFVQSMRGSNNTLNLEDLLKEFDLWDNRNQLIKTFSFGMKKRVALISAIVDFPKLLILDEPTNGLDTKSILVMKKYINYLKSKGSIVIISSHILEFVNQIADRIIFIKDGCITKEVICNDTCNLDDIYQKIYL